DIMGADIHAAQIGNLSSNDITISENLDVGNNAYVRNGLNVGSGGIFTNGNLSTTGTLNSLGTYSATVGTTNRDLFIDDSGNIGYVSSSQRYKEDIATETDISWLFDLRPVTFTYKSDPDNKLQYGLIAEEVELVNPLLVSYDELGQPETVSYSKLITPMLGAIQKQKLTQDKLTTDIETLLTKFTNIETRVSNLEASLQQSGVAIIPAGQTEVYVEFPKSYSENIPKVIVTLNSDLQVLFSVTNKTATGFTIKISAAVTQDLSFDWLSVR
ncbi:tail fiber domain-containing protein, partial [Candidatus Dojkabacteria bacterium]|nr:tail fiber domain-containing protein [Candidatus Dojkabacteria bacterium]